jgi:DNA-binding MarR family transcriptional regulator
VNSDLRDLAGRLYFVISRLHRRLRKVPRSDISFAQLGVLRNLEIQGPLSLGDLARMENMQPPSLTPLVSSLISLGMIEELGDSNDKRIKRVQITERGKRQLEESRRLKVDELVKYLSKFNDVQIQELENALDLLERLDSSE